MPPDGEKSGKPWRWKPGDVSAPQSGLLYEPGNWGDVLKGTWAALIAREIAKAGKEDTFIYFDPFAGSPEYPLTRDARERFEGLPESAFKIAQRSFVERDCWASTACVVQSVLSAAGWAALLHVFDADLERRAAWSKCPRVVCLNASSGLDVLRDLVLHATSDGTYEEERLDLVLVDPYDLFDRWGVFLDLAQDLAQRCPVLLYLYNKSPRGTGYADQYGRLRIALANRFRDCGVKVRLGRVPSDLKEPRAYHEVILAAPLNQPYSAFEDALRAATEDLAKLFPDSFTCFEDGLRLEGA